MDFVCRIFTSVGIGNVFLFFSFFLLCLSRNNFLLLYLCWDEIIFLCSVHLIQLALCREKSTCISTFHCSCCLLIFWFHFTFIECLTAGRIFSFILFLFLFIYVEQYWPISLSLARTMTQKFVLDNCSFFSFILFEWFFRTTGYRICYCNNHNWLYKMVIAFEFVSRSCVSLLY